MAWQCLWGQCLWNVYYYGYYYGNVYVVYMFEKRNMLFPFPSCQTCSKSSGRFQRRLGRTGSILWLHSTYVALGCRRTWKNNWHFSWLRLQRRNAPIPTSEPLPGRATRRGPQKRPCRHPGWNPLRSRPSTTGESRRLPSGCCSCSRLGRIRKCRQ